MTLQEAINHAKEKIDNTKCGQEHKQLYEWLLELQELRKRENYIKKAEEELDIYHCLVNAGVDNWEGYDIAMEMCNE